MKTYSVFLLVLFYLSGTAAGYTRITSSSGQMPKWPSMPIPYWINERGLSQIPNGSEFYAVQSAFQTWEDVETARMDFDYRGTTPVRGAARDGMSVVSFADDSLPLGSSTVAAAFSFFGRDGDAIVTQETDIVFNSAFQFSTSGEDGKFDVQSVLTHEVGHLLGLDHSGLVSSVMMAFALPSRIDQRTLMYDDIAGASEIYPEVSNVPPVGQIRGTILAHDSTGVFGAHVVAVDHNGTPLVSTISQPGGSFLIKFLLPGTYRVYAEPLDLPVSEQHIGGGPASWYRDLKTDFGTTYFGGISSQLEARRIEVTAGSTAVADIQVLPAGTTGLNITRPPLAPRIPRGTLTTLRIGGEDITPGIGIATSSTALTLGLPSFGGRISSVASTSATMELNIADSAPLGPKNVMVDRSGAVSILSGALVITNAPPSDIQVTPATGPAQEETFVTITGRDFRPGTSVYFGGLPASDIRVVDSFTIHATAPQNSPGPALVQVISDDGSSGGASEAFVYTSPPPSIHRVFPLSGSPATTVVIEGRNFDSRIQNVEVRFNGKSARVSKATENSIETVVPFGATSGPVTVTIFDKTTTGPEFTVTAPVPSSNVPGAAYNFINATAASGGTPLSFSGLDDAITLVTLPFNFSLFHDIYTAGSRVSVTTNGWLSLEIVSIPEFQNAFLPASTVTRPDGSTGVVAPALIAPFWDDLIMKSGISSISTRTVGTSPNRKFVVQWSRMSILNEQGHDLNADVTFEVILFEGSNDIQFLYESLSGPRSDGSSATSGVQNQQRQIAHQSGFNEPVLRSRFFVTYRFVDGAYRTEMADTTPPAKPLLAVGELTNSLTELAASWTSEDPESGIREFLYAVGSTPGAADVRPFASTTHNSVVVQSLNLAAGATYYFAVIAVNNAGLAGETGISIGIRIDPEFHPAITIVPSSPHGSTEFSGIALLAPVAMSVVMKAFDDSGNLVIGPGVRNPSAVRLEAGKRLAKLINELFGIPSFEGWIEIEASSPGLGVYTATGSRDMRLLDGSVLRALSSDFMFFRAGATAVLVNPSDEPATVALSEFNSGRDRQITIAGRGRVNAPLAGITRIRSNRPLAALEHYRQGGKLAVNEPVSVPSLQPRLLFPHGVVGGNYTTTLTLVNIGGFAQDVTVSFGTASRSVRLETGRTMRVSLAEFLQLQQPTVQTDAIRIIVSGNPFSASTIYGALDIENGSGLVTLTPRPAARETVFAHFVQGNDLFTGLSLAAADRDANVVIEVYPAEGGAPKTAELILRANEQVAKLVSELVDQAADQMSGYIRIRADEPIWVWELYGSAEAIASAPHL